MREDHLWMNWFPALIRVADAGKFIVLSALIFSGIIARHVAVRDTSKDPFRIIPWLNRRSAKKQEHVSSDGAVIMALAVWRIVRAAGPKIVVHTAPEL